MIGIFVELVISWILLRLIEKKGLSALGLRPNRQRIRELAVGLLLTIPFFTVFYLIVSFLVHNPYTVDPNYSIKAAANALAYLWRSVAYEELMFRGALLYVLIKRMGTSRAVLVSGIAFGIYHWFSYGVLGQPVQMLVVFITTGLAGYIMAIAFAKTRSMYLPFGLHFGIDLVPMILFSKDNSQTGLHWLVKSFATDPYNPGVIASIFVYIVYFAWFPLLTFWYFRRRRTQNN
jgi:membrane protease YdiL (CAAX protease family)